MPQLIKLNRIYIAQPPLYQVSRGKKSEFVLNENRLRELLGKLALDRTCLVIRNDEGENGRIEGDQLKATFELLGHLEDMVEIVERRGVKFPDFLSLRTNDPEGADRLPKIKLVVDKGNGDKERHYFWSEEAEDQFRTQNNLQEADLDKDGKGDSDTVGVVRKELHEVKELGRLIAKLADGGLSIDDYLIEREESPSGEVMPTKFALEIKGNETPHEVADISSMLDAILEAGKQGVDLKRFKGLGEMDPEQLWDTTMNPAFRTLLRVTWDAASEAELLFSTLMGEDVEPRRRYIEEHALEVKNLDV
jgi:DNA gyrase subunit B